MIVLEKGEAVKWKNAEISELLERDGAIDGFVHMYIKFKRFSQFSLPPHLVLHHVGFPKCPKSCLNRDRAFRTYRSHTETGPLGLHVDTLLILINHIR